MKINCPHCNKEIIVGLDLSNSKIEDIDAMNIEVFVHKQMEELK